MNEIPRIDVEELHERLERGDRFVVLDVREPGEWRLCRIEGSLHMPLSRLARRVEEIPKERDVVIVCHHGVRSRLVAERLRALGYDRVFDLRGGIDAWARRIDPEMRRY